MGFEHMRVYQAAELLDAEVLRLIGRIARGHARDVDQLKRAAGSLVYNIAEAYGSEQIGKKITFLEVAKATCDETRAVLQRLVRDKALDKHDIYKAASLSRAASKMLAAWISQAHTNAPA